jgi:hypothetical protein
MRWWRDVTCDTCGRKAAQAEVNQHGWRHEVVVPSIEYGD